MNKQQRNKNIDNINRAKNLAFWQWEYTRRNPKYKELSDELTIVIEELKKLGVFYEMFSKENAKTIMSFSEEIGDENYESILDIPFFKHLFIRFGGRAVRQLFHWTTLINRFEIEFKRPLKPSWIGHESDYILSELLCNKEYLFETCDYMDIIALLRNKEKWALTIGGIPPNLTNTVFNCYHPMNIDKQATFDNPTLIHQEAEVLKFLRNGPLDFVFDGKIDPVGINAVYKLSSSGQYTNNSNISRLIGVWLWDQAHFENEHTPLAFNIVYKKLIKKIEESGATGGAWEQVQGKRTRILKYYNVTSDCIKSMAVLPLQAEAKPK